MGSSLWALLDRRAVEPPHEPRAMGPVMMAMRRDKVIADTGRYTVTARPVAHTAMIRVWRSLTYGGHDGNQ